MNNITLAQTIKAPNIQEFITDVLGGKKEQFVSDLMSLQEATPALKKCDQIQLIKCAMTATALDLPLNKNLGYAYVVPYGNQAQFQMGYKGFVQLAMRSGQYKVINVCEVREGEMFRNKFTGDVQFLEDKPDNDIIGYLAYFKLLNGMEQSLYMSINELNEHRDKYSKSGKGNTGVWKDNTDAMCKKTVLKLLLSRWGILSVQMQEAIVKDQANGDGEYIDNAPIKTDYETKEQNLLLEEDIIIEENED